MQWPGRELGGSGRSATRALDGGGRFAQLPIAHPGGDLLAFNNSPRHQTRAPIRAATRGSASRPHHCL